MNGLYILATLVAVHLGPPVTGQVVTLEKKISGRFAANKGKLSIDNSYGKLKINTWYRNEVTVDVTITAKAASANSAEELLDKVSILEPGSNGNGITYKTVINHSNKSSGKDGEFRIDYVINMPLRHSADFINKYGDIELSDADGKLNIDLNYGSLKTGVLNGADKNIEVAYGNATIRSLEVGNVRSSYSRLLIEKAGSIDVSNKAGKTVIGTARDLSIDQKYGDLKIGSVDKLSGTVEYGGLHVGKLLKSLQMNLKYSPGAKYSYIGPDVNNISVNSSYSSLYFHFDDAASLKTDVVIVYGKINNGTSNISLIESKSDRTGQASTYTGRVGRGRGAMELNVSYGNVVFK